MNKLLSWSLQLVSQLGCSFITTPGYLKLYLSFLLLSCLLGTHRSSKSTNVQSSQTFSEHTSGPGHVCYTSPSLVCMVVVLLSHYSFTKFSSQTLSSYDIQSVCCSPLPPSHPQRARVVYVFKIFNRGSHTSKATST